LSKHDDTAQATLAAWRARGAHPVRLRFIEALARRAEAHTGEARRRLDERLAALMADYARALESADTPPASRARAGRPPALPSPLRELLDAMAQHARADEPAPAAGGTVPALPAAGAAGALTELRSVRRFSATWTRLAADHRLAQSLEHVPANAGPLNSQHLVHQALATMHEASPAYLGRFLAHVDALLWLEQAQPAAKPPAARR
jgi:hypothetical protein